MTTDTSTPPRRPKPSTHLAVYALMYVALSAALVAFTVSVSNPTPVETNVAHAAVWTALALATMSATTALVLKRYYRGGE